MKRERKKTTYLRLVILLFCIPILFYRCNKEDPLIYQNTNPEIEQIKSQFNLEEFKDVIPYSYNVDWENSEIQYLDELKSNFYEFSLNYNTNDNPKTFNKNKEKGYYNSYKIIALKKDENNFQFFVFKAYEKIINKNNTETDIHLKNIPKNFSGYIHLLNGNNEIVYAKKFKNGVKSLNDFYGAGFKSLNPLKGKMLEECNPITTYHYKDWYSKRTLDDGTVILIYTHREYLGSTTEMICSYEWLPEYGGGGSGEGTFKDEENGEGVVKKVIKDYNCPGMKIKNPNTGICECPSGYIEDSNGDCIINPCINLKNRINSNDINQHFSSLSDKLNYLSERGYLYFKINNQFESREIAVSPFNSNSVNISTGSNIYGAGHTHTDDLFSMFSWNDVHSLYSLYKNADTSLKESVMFYLTSRNSSNSDTNFYVIKVHDFNKLKDQLTTDINNVIKNSLDLNSNSTINDVIEILNNNLGNLYNSSVDFEKTFLDRFKEHGIKLYKSKNDVTNLTELKIDNFSNTVKETPCN